MLIFKIYFKSFDLEDKIRISINLKENDLYTSFNDIFNFISLNNIIFDINNILLYNLKHYLDKSISKNIIKIITNNKTLEFDNDVYDMSKINTDFIFNINNIIIDYSINKNSNDLNKEFTNYCLNIINETFDNIFNTNQNSNISSNNSIITISSNKTKNKKNKIKKNIDIDDDFIDNNNDDDNIIDDNYDDDNYY